MVLSPQHHSFTTSGRVNRLSERINADEHVKHRVSPPKGWCVPNSIKSLPERRAHALLMVCESMPIVIETEEIIVGMRTFVNSNNPEGLILPNYLPKRSRLSRKLSQKSLQMHRRGVSHNVPGFGKFLTYGLGGLIEQAENNLHSTSNKLKKSHLSSFMIACKATSVLLKRYADHAKELSLRTENDQRKFELGKISETCEYLIGGVPRNLHEALQLYWIAYLLIVIEVRAFVSMGRIDQILLPFWPKDESDTKVLEDAQNLIDCFVIKCNDINELSKGTGRINNQIMLSGLTREGTDATNPVTWAFLSSVDRLNLQVPQPAVRLHKDCPKELSYEICRLWRKGRSQLSVYNDDVFVPALHKANISIEDARDYAIDACQDINIFGKSDFFNGLRIDMAGLLLQALESAPTESDWDTFLSLFKSFIKNDINRTCKTHYDDLTIKVGTPTPLLSVSLDDCLETGLGMSSGGLAIKNKGIFFGNPVPMINSLAAVKYLVYEKGICTLEKLKTACKSNWKGYEDLQKKALGAPKWGNDDDFVDLMGANIFKYAAEELWGHKLPDGSSYLSGIHQANYLKKGEDLNSTPDGRNDGDPIPPSLSPANHTSNKGPTAVMKSVCKIDPMVTQWNSSLSLMLNPSSLDGEQNLLKFDALVRTWIKMGGQQLQINVVSKKMLEDALADPKNHQDLIVRVWGYCARYIDILPMYQYDLIERTTQEL